jgi:hypothetical protein
VVIVTVLVSLAVMPDWPVRWWHATHKTAAVNYSVPLVAPGGILLLLAALRWRTPEGRLLLVMSCVPQSMLMYDQFPLLLIARTRLEATAFALWTHVAPFALGMLMLRPSVDDKVHTLPFLTRLLTWALYLPALAVVLRRPNEGSAPVFLERLYVAVSRWVRGCAA